jgi:hypothetical protein
MKIADLYLSDLFVEEQIRTEYGPEYTTVEVEPAILETYVGVYEIEPGQQIQIRRNGRQINIRMPDDGWETIYPVDETKFLTLDGKSSCIFEHDSPKQISHIIINHQNNEILAQRVKPYQPSLTELNDYIGNYYSDELLTAYTIIIRDSALVMQHQRNSDLLLQPLSKDIFRGIGFYGQLQFERDRNDHISGFRIDLGRVQHLLFTRHQ